MSKRLTPVAHGVSRVFHIKCPKCLRGTMANAGHLKSVPPKVVMRCNLCGHEYARVER